MPFSCSISATPYTTSRNQQHTTRQSLAQDPSNSVSCQATTHAREEPATHSPSPQTGPPTIHITHTHTQRPPETARDNMGLHTEHPRHEPPTVKPMPAPELSRTPPEDATEPDSQSPKNHTTGPKPHRDLNEPPRPKPRQNAKIRPRPAHQRARETRP